MRQTHFLQKKRKFVLKIEIVARECADLIGLSLVFIYVLFVIKLAH